METRGIIGIMERNMETRAIHRENEKKMEIIGMKGIMEKNMETRGVHRDNG